MKKWLDLGAHVILGLIFLVFGLNGFLNFIPVPPPATEAAEAYMSGLMAAGYFFPLLKVVEIVVGLMLLTRRFVPLGLVLLAPIVVQIFLHHAFNDRAGLPMAVVLLLLQGYLGFGVYRESFRQVLAARPED